MQPKRMQLSRRKGWRLPFCAMKVDRSTRYGNPFVVTDERTADEAVSAFRIWLTTANVHAGLQVEKEKLLAALPKLRGKDLACWCKLDKPCHADVLLELANADPTTHNYSSASK